MVFWENGIRYADGFGAGWNHPSMPYHSIIHHLFKYSITFPTTNGIISFIDKFSHPTT